MPPLSPFNRTCLALAIGQAITLPSQAATIEVNSITDSPGPDCTLREAVVSINDQSTPLQEGCYNSSSAALGTDDTITFDASLSGQTITLTNGQLVISNNTLSIIGLGQDQLTIDGNNASRVFNITAATVSLDSLTITGGSSGSNGGGIVAVLGSSVSLTRSTVSNNSANSGGAINAVGSSVSLVNSTVSNNSAISVGGGIDARDSSNVSLTNSTVSGNTAAGGGGIYALSSSIILANSTVSGNTAWLNNGGGIYARISSSVSLTNSTVSGNTAGTYGGGISANNTSRVSLTNSTVSGNTVGGNGGGIYARISSSVSLTNSTVSGNTVGGNGGGIWASNSSSVSLVNSLVSGNTATISGDELYSDGGSPITADNSNVFGHNAIDTTVAFTNFTPGTTDIVATIDAAPAGVHLPTALSSILNPLTNNGCQQEAGAPSSSACIKTHALAPNSPALDAADDTLCPDFDQRGEPREEDACDIGAFEGSVDNSSCYVINTAGSKTIVFCL